MHCRGCLLGCRAVSRWGNARAVVACCAPRPGQALPKPCVPPALVLACLAHRASFISALQPGTEIERKDESAKKDRGSMRKGGAGKEGKGTKRKGDAGEEGKGTERKGGAGSSKDIAA